MAILNAILIAIVAPLVALYALIKWRPGSMGEWSLHIVLSFKLDKKRFRVLRNVMLPTSDGTTTQIDHIVVSQGGIFVIETKTYGNNGTRNRPGSCWIFGDARDREWTASYPRGRKFRFQNPIRQNFKHMATLSECLGVPMEYFKSVVAFSGTAEFKTEMPTDVMHFHSVAGYLLEQSAIPVIKLEQVPEVAETILEWQRTLSRKTKAAHVENLRKKHAEIPTSPDPMHSKFPFVPSTENTPSCPKCGLPMVLRKRKSDGGSFWGCSSYPECRGIRNIDHT